MDFETVRFDRRLPAVRATGPIRIDGILDEDEWEGAPIASGFTQGNPNEGMPATFETEVRVLYDDEFLYVGAFAHDDEPDGIIVNDLSRDFSTRAGDIFGVLLDTFHDRRNGYMFETNPRRRQVRRADFQRGTGIQPRLGRRLARQHPAGFRRLVRRDGDPVQDAAVS